MKESKPYWFEKSKSNYVIFYQMNNPMSPNMNIILSYNCFMKLAYVKAKNKIQAEERLRMKEKSESGLEIDRMKILNKNNKKTKKTILNIIKMGFFYNTRPNIKMTIRDKTRFSKKLLKNLYRSFKTCDLVSNTFTSSDRFNMVFGERRWKDCKNIKVDDVKSLGDLIDGQYDAFLSRLKEKMNKLPTQS